MQSFASFFGFRRTGQRPARPVTQAEIDEVKKFAEDQDKAANFRRYVLVNSKDEYNNKKRFAASHAERPAQRPAPLRPVEPINLPEGVIGNLQFNAIPASGDDTLPVYKPKIILTVGCQGEANKTQHEVALLMEEVVTHYKNAGYDVACILVLGDNIYKNGADSPNDSKFNDCCYDVYTTALTPNLQKIKFFYIQGNHDQNRHNWKNFSLNVSGINLGLNQVAHTFLPRKEGETVEKLQKIFGDKLTDDPLDDRYILNTEDLNHFNMPGRAYSLIIEDMEIFCIDSNTFVQDYKDLEKNPLLENQVSWLIKAYAKSKAMGKKPVLALHHPPATVGKREFGNDVGFYTDEKKGSYNKRVCETLTTLGLKFDAIFAAHDHGMYYYLDSEKHLPLVVSAGGGSTLQERLDVKTNKKVATFLEAYGCVAFASEGDSLNFMFHSNHRLSPKTPLVFNNKSVTPFRVWKKEDVIDVVKKYNTATPAPDVNTYHLCADEAEYKKVLKLYEVVTEAIDKFMGRMMNKSVNKKGQPELDQTQMNIAHDLLTFINGPIVHSFDITLINLYKIAKLDPKSETSLEKFETDLINAYGDHFNDASIFRDFERTARRAITNEPALRTRIGF